MKEIRYWEAEDGERFYVEEECEEYERDCLWGKLLDVVSCYDRKYKRIIKTYAEICDCSDIAYIIIPSATPGSEFINAYEELDEEFFDGRLPCLEGYSTSGDLAYCDDSNVWHVWSEEIANLREMAEKFQLFEGE